MAELEFFVAVDGAVQCVYSDEAARLLSGLGTCVVRRASHVEPTADGRWHADMTPSGGPVLGPFPIGGREAAVAAELAWLRENQLTQGRRHGDQDPLLDPRQEDQVRPRAEGPAPG